MNSLADTTKRQEDGKNINFYTHRKGSINNAQLRVITGFFMLY